MRKRRLVYHANRYGLANRLRALVGYLAIARMAGLSFALSWEVDGSMDSSFDELFDQDRVDLLSASELDALRRSDDTCICTSAEWFTDLRSMFFPRLPEEAYLREVYRSIQSLRPVDDICEEVSEYAKRHSLRSVPGVHVRLTDHVSAYHYWAEHSRDFRIECTSSKDGFASVIANLCRQGMLFLATDEHKFEHTCSILGGRNLLTFRKVYNKLHESDLVVDVTRDYRPPKRGSSVRAALIEMLLLGRCESILGTYFSSFSQFSAVWGGVPYQELLHATPCANEQISSIQRSFASFGNDKTVPKP